MSFKNYITEQVQSGRETILETSVVAKSDRAVSMFAEGKGKSFIRKIKTAWQGQFVEMAFKDTSWKLLEKVIKEGKGAFKDDTGISFDVEKIDEIVVLDSPDLGTLKLSHGALKEMTEAVLRQKPNIPKGAKAMPKGPPRNAKLLKSLVSISK